MQVGRMYLLMSKNAELAQEAGNPGSEPEDYVVTGIELMEVKKKRFKRNIYGYSCIGCSQ